MGNSRVLGDAAAVADQKSLRRRAGTSLRDLDQLALLRFLVTEVSCLRWAIRAV